MPHRAKSGSGLQMFVLAGTEVNILHKAYPDWIIHTQRFIPENIKITEEE